MRTGEPEGVPPQPSGFSGWANLEHRPRIGAKYVTEKVEKTDPDPPLRQTVF